MKTRRKELPEHPLLDNGNSVNLSFYLNHYYTHISKQIVEYIFSLNKYIESWDAVLINQLTSPIHGIQGCTLDKSVELANFAEVNNLTTIFYTVLTKSDFLLSWFRQ